MNFKKLLPTMLFHTKGKFMSLIDNIYALISSVLVGVICAIFDLPTLAAICFGTFTGIVVHLLEDILNELREIKNLLKTN